MIKVKPSKEVLVRLTVATVLGDDDAWHGLKDFRRTGDGTFIQFLGANCSLRLGVSNAKHTVASLFHHDLSQLLHIIGCVACCSS